MVPATMHRSNVAIVLHCSGGCRRSRAAKRLPRLWRFALDRGQRDFEDSYLVDLSPVGVAEWQSTAPAVLDEIGGA